MVNGDLSRFSVVIIQTVGLLTSHLDSFVHIFRLILLFYKYIVSPQPQIGSTLEVQFSLC